MKHIIKILKFNFENLDFEGQFNLSSFGSIPKIRFQSQFIKLKLLVYK
jgi:hypothetical protein